MPKVSLSRYSLTVDTGETFTSMFDAAGNEHGDQLTEALSMALGTDWTYVVPTELVITADDLRRDDPTPDMPCVSDGSPSKVLTNLQAGGYLTTDYALHERASETYLSEGRGVIVVHVNKPFYVITFHCSSSEPVETWQTQRSSVVPAGLYLVAEINDEGSMPRLIGTAGMNELPDDVVVWLFELEGFCASVCFARCDICRADWLAEAGSWQFRPDGCDADPWYFDDAQDFRVDSIACPACETGRVGFDT
jgi:hypothetical protein